jgi:hypothetical protein
VREEAAFGCCCEDACVCGCADFVLRCLAMVWEALRVSSPRTRVESCDWPCSGSESDSERARASLLDACAGADLVLNCVPWFGDHYVIRVLAV